MVWNLKQFYLKLCMPRVNGSDDKLFIFQFCYHIIEFIKVFRVVSFLEYKE